MKSLVFISVSLSVVLLSIGLVSCISTPNLPIQLASFSENDVSVSILLEQPTAGNFVIAATFTPPDGYHLYSKDIPIHGINGIGRPTLLELATESQTKTLGSVTENVRAEGFFFEQREFQVYPLGAVTLSLPIKLPAGQRWVSDEIKITFMACSSNLCKAPVEGKIVAIRVPGAELFDNK
jgi:hypothetical protein